MPVNTNLTIGADPEFVFLSPLSGEPQPAQSVFHTPYATSAGTKFGYDGNPNTAELRPEPSDDPLQLVENIYRILLEAKEEFSDAFRLDLKSSCSSYSIGGHIHFGHSSFRNYDSNRLSPFTAIVKDLDLLLTVPFSLVEVPAHHKSRVGNSGYGKLGDFRTQNWGFEYRPLGSWLSSRRLAESVVTLAHSIVNQRLIYGDKWSPSIHKAFEYNEIKQIYSGCHTSVFRALMPLISKSIRQLDGYKEYKKQIEYLIDSSKSGKILADTEMKEGWKIDFIKIINKKLSNMPDLIRQLAEGVTLSPSSTTATTNLFSSSKDFMVYDISTNVSNSIFNIIGDDILKQIKLFRFRVYGLKAEPKNIIRITVPDTISERVLADTALAKLLNDLLKEFGYKHELKIDQIPDTDKIHIGLPRSLRERDDFLAEGVLIATWMHLNRQLCGAMFDKKPLMNKKNVVHPLCIVIKDHKRVNQSPISGFYNDAGEPDVHLLAEFLRSRYGEQSIDEDRRIRLIPGLRNLLEEILQEDDHFDCRVDCLERGGSISLSGLSTPVNLSRVFRNYCDHHLIYRIYTRSIG